MFQAVALILTIGLVILLAFGVPVAFSLGTLGAIGYIVYSKDIGVWMNQVAGSLPMKMSGSLSNFVLLSIPLFVLAAKIMNGSSITHRIFKFANTAVGWLPGGPGHAKVVASLIFAGMSGTAVSDAAGLGQIEIEAMNNAGYDPEFSAGVTAASSTVAPIFPPSVPMVMYSTVSGASVGALFMGGVVPGVLMSAAMMALIVMISLKRGYPREKFPTFKEFIKAFWEALIPCLTPVILLAGIWSGRFTATEAAVIATTYAFVVSMFIFREMTLSKFWQIVKEVLRDAAQLGMIVAAANFYGWVLARCGVTNAVSNWLAGITSSPAVFMLIVNIALIIIGCFMDPTASIMVFGPVLITAATSMGIDLTYFGVVMVFNLMIGLCTPPFGVCLFITADIAKVSFAKMIKGMLPFYVPLFACLILMTIFPGIITWLPHLLGQ